MKKEYEAYLSMLLKVRNFAVKNANTLKTLPGVEAQITQLNTYIDQLIMADTGSQIDLTGVAVLKQKRRTALEGFCLKVSNALTALAVNTHDVVLQKKAAFTSSFWYKCTEDELITKATIVKNLATPYAADLTPYGVVAADLTAFEKAIAVFTDTISDPSLAIDQRKADNSRIVELIDNIRTLLGDKLDVLVRLTESTDPIFYNLYLSARAIDTRGSVAKALVEKSIEPNTVVELYNMPKYNPEGLFTIQNLGNEALYFSLSSDAKTEGETPVLLDKGETRSRLARNLAPAGTHFMIRNSGVTACTVRLWLDE